MRIRLEKVSPKVEDPMGPHGARGTISLPHHPSTVHAKNGVGCQKPPQKKTSVIRLVITKHVLSIYKVFYVCVHLLAKHIQTSQLWWLPASSQRLATTAVRRPSLKV